VDAAGQQVGVVSINDALAAAKSDKLDLVEIVPTSEPPVCRVMDYGKHQFEIGKRKQANKKKQKTVQLKEIKFTPVTDIGDFNVKVNKIIAFLERGDKVKVSLRFKGRQMQHRELGLDLLQRVLDKLPEQLVIEQAPKLEGRQLTMIVVYGK
jgi:translation initiation factor IF-3